MIAPYGAPQGFIDNMDWYSTEWFCSMTHISFLDIPVVQILQWSDTLDICILYICTFVYFFFYGFTQRRNFTITDNRQHRRLCFVRVQEPLQSIRAIVLIVTFTNATDLHEEKEGSSLWEENRKRGTLVKGCRANRYASSAVLTNEYARPSFVDKGCCIMFHVPAGVDNGLQVRGLLCEVRDWNVLPECY